MQSPWVAGITALVTAAMVVSAADEAPGQVSSQRRAALAKGVNLSWWFAQGEVTADRVRTRIRTPDIRLIRSLGFRHVRLTADPLFLAKRGDLSSPDPRKLALLDGALDMILAEDLAVILCPYLENRPKSRLLSDRRSADQFADFCGALAGHLARRDANRLFLETMNEPSSDDQPAVGALQVRLVGCIRKAAPVHTIIVSTNLRAGGGWDPLGGLLAAKPVPDKNVLYDLHFYDPVQFTHQGATWMTWQVRYLKGLPYPSTPQNVTAPLKNVSVLGARKYGVQYGREQWNRRRIAERIAQVIEWGRKNEAAVICGEFGVYRTFCPPADRNRYLRDLREVFEEGGIGWTHWDYLGSFGVVTEEEGKRVLDRDTAAALGLNLPTTRPASSQATLPAADGPP